MPHNTSQQTPPCPTPPRRYLIVDARGRWAFHTLPHLLPHLLPHRIASHLAFRHIFSWSYPALLHPSTPPPDPQKPHLRAHSKPHLRPHSKPPLHPHSKPHLRAHSKPTSALTASLTSALPSRWKPSCLRQRGWRGRQAHLAFDFLRVLISAQGGGTHKADGV